VVGCTGSKLMVLVASVVDDGPSCIAFEHGRLIHWVGVIRSGRLFISSMHLHCKAKYVDYVRTGVVYRCLYVRLIAYGIR